MGIELLTEGHKDQIAGVLSCRDRVLWFGTLPKICYAAGMTSYLYERKIRIFDYPKFAEPLRNELRENAERLAADTGIQIEFLRKRNVRKEDRVKEILAQRGGIPRLVWAEAQRTRRHSPVGLRPTRLTPTSCQKCAESECRGTK